MSEEIARGAKVLINNGNKNRDWLRRELGDAYRRIVDRAASPTGRQTDESSVREGTRMPGHLRRMENGGKLTGSLTQYFNNILTLIIGYGSYMQVSLDEKDPLRPYVHQILASSEKAALLTRSLLAFYGKQVANPKPVDVNEIIRRTGKLIGRIMGERIELRMSLSRSELTVLADPVQLEQVMMNLATNARDAMPGGGTLTIHTRVVKERRPAFGGDGNEGKCATISVSDTGSGIDERERENIFVPFYTTKEPGKVAGPGLSIVYGIIKQHKGSINVTSDPGRGTTLSIYLPMLVARAGEGHVETRASALRGTCCS
ncbi:MAG: ATP-binding protein [Syntrophorhabdales bacterium]|jgi:signal transduction histidine kinase